LKRNYLLDQYRGITIISMVLFHLFFDISLYRPLDRYDGTLFNKIWQISIATSFFTISGITSNFLDSKKNIKRGIKLTILGFLISLITYLFDKDLLILFGVLNGLGISMIITGLIQKNDKLKASHAIIFLLLFIIFYKLPSGRILVKNIYSSLYELNLFPLGFPSKSFYSTDYFPLIPRIFIYLFGFCLGKLLVEKNFYNKYGKNNFLAKIGQHSIEIYLAHQIIIYFLVEAYFRFLA
jgi:uncharacterized membrane protein